MREYNLQLQGLTKAQIDKSNQPLPEEVIKSNWEGFSALLQGRTLQPTTTANARTTRRRSKRAAPTLTEALVDERVSNATNVKVLPSKHHKTRQRKVYKKERASRRIAKRSVAPPLHEPLQRNASTRKGNPAGPRSKEKSIAVEPAKHRGALKSGQEGTHRLTSKKQSGG